MRAWRTHSVHVPINAQATCTSWKEWSAENEYPSQTLQRTLQHFPFTSRYTIDYFMYAVMACSKAFFSGIASLASSQPEFQLEQPSCFRCIFVAIQQPETSLGCIPSGISYMWFLGRYSTALLKTWPASRQLSTDSCCVCLRREIRSCHSMSCGRVSN